MYGLIAIPKAICYWVINVTFPRTAAIALMSGGASWYANRYGKYYIAEYLARSKITPIVHSAFNSIGLDWVSSNTKNWVAHFFAPFTPGLEAAEYSTLAISIGAGCATSVTLNLLDIGIEKIRSCWQKTHPKEETAPPSPHVVPGYRKDIAEHLEKNFALPDNSYSIPNLYFQAEPEAE